MKRIKIVIMCMVMAIAFASCSKVTVPSDTPVSETTVIDNTESAQANIDSFMNSYNEYCKSEEASFDSKSADVAIPNGETGKVSLWTSADSLYKKCTVEVESANSLKAFEYYKINDNDMFIAISILNNDGSVEPTVKYYAVGSEIHAMDSEDFAVVSDPASLGLYTSFSQIEEIYG